MLKLPVRFHFSSLGIALAMAACWAPASTAMAQPIGLGLAQANNCVACHNMERKVVGPSFNAIAERFAGQSDAADALVQSILQGSRNKWGPVPMPRQLHVAPDDAQALARWILSLYQDKTKLPETPSELNQENK